METRVLGNLALFTLAILPACGGGGGSSGPSVSGRGWAPHTGPGDVGNHFPNAVGNQWSLNYSATVTGGASATGVLTGTIVEPRTMFGVSATVLSETDSQVPGVFESYFGVSPGGVTALGNDSVDDPITPRLVPYAFLLFPVELGTISTLHASHLPIGFDQLGNPLTLDAVQVIENVQYEPLETFAGSFPSTVKQLTSISGSVRDAALNITLPYSGSETRWLAPGAGIVRQANSVTVDTISTSSDALVRGYRVNGVRHGVGETLTVLDHLSPDDGNPSPPLGIQALASDGTNFLVVGRKVGGASPVYVSNWVAQRVAADGTLLGTRVELGAPMPMADPYNIRRAAVVFDGVEYLVVHEQDEGSSPSGWRRSLVAARIATDGTLVGAPAVVAASSEASPSAAEPALCFDGTRCLLVFVRRDSSGLTRTTGVFVSPATGQAAGPEFAISAEAGSQTLPALAFDGVQYLALWNREGWGSQTPGLVAARITLGGAVLDPAGIVVHNAITSVPAVGCDGGNFLVLWEDGRQQSSSQYNNIYGNRVSPNGALLDGNAQTGGFAVTHTVGRSEVAPSLVHFDGSYLVVWLSSSSPGVYEGLYGTRVSAAGAPLGPGEGTLLTTGGYQGYPRLAAGSGSALLAWLEAFGVGLASTSVKAVGLHPRGS